MHGLHHIYQTANNLCRSEIPVQIFSLLPLLFHIYISNFENCSKAMTSICSDLFFFNAKLKQSTVQCIN